MSLWKEGSHSRQIYRPETALTNFFSNSCREETSRSSIWSALDKRVLTSAKAACRAAEACCCVRAFEETEDILNERKRERTSVNHNDWSWEKREQKQKTRRQERIFLSFQKTKDWSWEHKQKRLRRTTKAQALLFSFFLYLSFCLFPCIKDKCNRTIDRTKLVKRGIEEKRANGTQRRDSNETKKKKRFLLINFTMTPQSTTWLKPISKCFAARSLIHAEMLMITTWKVPKLTVPQGGKMNLWLLTLPFSCWILSGFDFHFVTSFCIHLASCFWFPFSLFKLSCVPWSSLQREKKFPKSSPHLSLFLLCACFPKVSFVNVFFFSFLFLFFADKNVVDKKKERRNN